MNVDSVHKYAYFIPDNKLSFRAHTDSSYEGAVAVLHKLGFLRINQTLHVFHLVSCEFFYDLCFTTANIKYRNALNCIIDQASKITVEKQVSLSELCDRQAIQSDSPLHDEFLPHWVPSA